MDKALHEDTPEEHSQVNLWDSDGPFLLRSSVLVNRHYVTFLEKDRYNPNAIYGYKLDHNIFSFTGNIKNGK